MTKHFRFITIALLCAAMLLSAVSCDGKSGGGTVTTEAGTTTAEIVTEPPKYEPESGIDLWNKVDETMKSLDSYKDTSTVKCTYYYMGYEFNFEYSGTGVFCEDEVISKRSGSLTCEELSVNDTSESLEAYVGGKMYVANKSTVYDQKLCAEMTLEEFEKATSLKGLEDDVDLADCNRSEFEKNEDGDWVLTMSGYSGKTVTRFVKSMSMDAAEMGADIVDLEITLVADEDLLAKSAEFKLVFDDDDLTVVPEFVMFSEYSDIGTASIDPAEINTEEYTLVDDLAILNLLDEAISERTEAAAGKFTYETKTVTTVFGESQENTETDAVTYGRKNGAYYCDIEATISDGTSVQISYKNGTQTITYGGEPESGYMTDDDAKATVDSLIDSAGYDAAAINGIVKNSDTEYVLSVLDYDVSALNENLTDTGIVLSAGTQEITVTMAEDQVSRIASKVTADGEFTYEGQSSSVTIVWECAVTFEDMAEGTVGV